MASDPFAEPPRSPHDRSATRQVSSTGPEGAHAVLLCKRILFSLESDSTDDRESAL